MSITLPEAFEVGLEVTTTIQARSKREAEALVQKAFASKPTLSADDGLTVA